MPNMKTIVNSHNYKITKLLLPRSSLKKEPATA